MQHQGRPIALCPFSGFVSGPFPGLTRIHLGTALSRWEQDTPPVRCSRSNAAGFELASLLLCVCERESGCRGGGRPVVRASEGLRGLGLLCWSWVSGGSRAVPCVPCIPCDAAARTAGLRRWSQLGPPGLRPTVLPSLAAGFGEPGRCPLSQARGDSRPPHPSPCSRCWASEGGLPAASRPRWVSQSWRGPSALSLTWGALRDRWGTAGTPTEETAAKIRSEAFPPFPQRQRGLRRSSALWTLALPWGVPLRPEESGRYPGAPCTPIWFSSFSTRGH